MGIVGTSSLPTAHLLLSLVRRSSSPAVFGHGGGGGGGGSRGGGLRPGMDDADLIDAILTSEASHGRGPTEDVLLHNDDDLLDELTDRDLVEAIGATATCPWPVFTKHARFDHLTCLRRWIWENQAVPVGVRLAQITSLHPGVAFKTWGQWVDWIDSQIGKPQPPVTRTQTTTGHGSAPHSTLPV